MKFQKSTDAIGRLLVIMPFIKNVIPKQSGFAGIVDSSEYQWNLVKKQVQEHVQNFDKEWIRDYMGAYINKMEEYPHFSGRKII